MIFASAPSSSGSPSTPVTGRVLGIVPARLASSRLPRKPLHPLLGKPLVRWVAERAASMDVLDGIVVAADSEAIAEACDGSGIPVVLTDPSHPSGTDRVAEVAALEEWSDFAIVVNLQGDEPLMEPSHVQAAVDAVRAGWDVGTCAAPVGSALEWRNPSVVKVVRREDGSALYFSRAPIPHRRDGEPEPGDFTGETYLRHLGVYAYRRDALFRWVSLPPSPLEELERLEQLRALQAGMSIGVAVVSAAERGVDTPEDARLVEQRMRELGFGT